MLPIGVLVPTRNCAPLLSRHLESMTRWLDMVQEVVVVDSFSNDGTLEMIQAKLRYPRLNILSHPPGLYESWNHGIRHIAAKYCYISTVGDTITREGLEHLAATAENLGCDVLMSKPDFIAMDGTKAAAPFWPVDDMIEKLQIVSPKSIPVWQFSTFALAHAGEGLLGSSASNLYRTTALAARPFPVDFGRAGDGVWALQNCCRLDWGMTPKVCSTFLLHPEAAWLAEDDRFARDWGADPILRETIESELKCGRLGPAASRDLNVFALLEEMCGWLKYKQQFDRARKRQFPWILSPRAWQTRIKRNHHARNMAALKARLLREIQYHGLVRDATLEPARVSSHIRAVPDGSMLRP
jgi:hypothetical protein